MNNVSIFHDTGENYFKNGNSVYINFIGESSKPHLHVHEFIEISYVASGSGIHILGDKKYEVSKGDLFLINYHIPHEFRSLESPFSSPLKVYNCVFKPDFIDVNLNNYKDFSEVINYLSFRSIFSLESDNIDDIKILGTKNIEIETIYKKMLDEFTNEEDGYIELLRVYITELLIKIFRSFKKSSNNKSNIISHNDKLIEKSIQYLKVNYSISAKLTDIAAQSFLSPTYFCKLFKDYTGITVPEYVQKLRIEEACNLLKHTDYKIIVIAEKIGYKILSILMKCSKNLLV